MRQSSKDNRQPSVTTKIAPQALQWLRMIAGATGEQQREILIRLLEAEAKRLRLRAPKTP
jgi:hypothetical protein